MKSKDKYNLQFRPVNLLGLLQMSLALLLHDSALASHASGHKYGSMAPAGGCFPLHTVSSRDWH